MPNVTGGTGTGTRWASSAPLLLFVFFVCVGCHKFLRVRLVDMTAVAAAPVAAPVSTPWAAEVPVGVSGAKVAGEILEVFSGDSSGKRSRCINVAVGVVLPLEGPTAVGGSVVLVGVCGGSVAAVSVSCPIHHD